MESVGVEEREKGKSVGEQQIIWDMILHLRIRLQSAMRLCNQMPRGDDARRFFTDSDHNTKTHCRSARAKIRQLSNLLSNAQLALLSGCPMTRSLLKMKKNDGKDIDNENEEIESSSSEDDADGEEEEELKDESDESDEYQMIHSLDKQKSTLKKSHGHKKDPNGLNSAYKIFRNNTLNQWNERTSLAIASRKDGRDKKTNISSVPQQIEQVMNDRQRLIRRTRTKRCDLDRIGNVHTTDHEDPEIFDDGDFYEQLLKDVIDRKSSSINDPIALSRHWLEMQKLRQRRSKRTSVDTKASKGRKTRYTLIPKLVGFHSARPSSDSAAWTHEARTELFRSLFAP